MTGTDVDFDVVVVGAGGAGLAAAVAAHDAGASVLVLEAARQVGGATALAGGSFMAAGTDIQRANGYEDDTADAFFEYYMTFNQWCLEPSVIRRFCDEGPATIDWLTSLGVNFLPDVVTRAGLETAPRTHRAAGGGNAYVETLFAACRARDIDIAFDNRVEDLIVEDGRVVGAVARGEQVHCHSVVLATGGFGANRALIAEHYPEADQAGDWVWSPCPETNRGDGLRLAAAANASTAGHDHGDIVLTSGITKDLEPFPPGWLVYVNSEGRRFIREDAPYTVMPAVFGHQGGWAWCVFDEASRAAATADPNTPFGAGTWVAETLEAAADVGDILRHDTLDELAQAMGVRAQAMQRTIGRYNADCALGVDTQFLKNPAMMRPIVVPPFHAVVVKPAVVALTAYGPRIDADACVLDIDDQPIPGLYAAGEVTGNVLGKQYLGGGNAIGSALIFGRIAGRNAATRS